MKPVKAAKQSCCNSGKINITALAKDLDVSHDDAMALVSWTCDPSRVRGLVAVRYLSRVHELQDHTPWRTTFIFT
jgi:hypothetical protein